MKAIIYQENDPKFRVDANKIFYDKSQYKKVYSMTLTEGQEEQFNANERDLLEELFEKFNVNKPEDFNGHSMSVGDIVEFRAKEELGMGAKQYICDSFGWQRIAFEEDK